MKIKGHITVVAERLDTGAKQVVCDQDNLWLDQGRRNLVNTIGITTPPNHAFIVLSDSTDAPVVTNTAIPGTIYTYSGQSVSPTSTYALLGTAVTRKMYQLVPAGVRTINTIGVAKASNGASAWCYTKLLTGIAQNELTQLHIYYSITISPYPGVIA